MPDVDGRAYVYLAGPDVFYPDPKNRARLMSQVGVILWSLRRRPTIGCPERHSRGFALSRDRRVGVAVGLWFQCHGSSHSPTIGLVRAFGITDPSEVGDRVG